MTLNTLNPINQHLPHQIVEKTQEFIQMRKPLQLLSML